MLEWAVSFGVLVILVLLIRRLFQGRISLGLIAHKPRMLAATGGLVAALLAAVSCVACTGAKDHGAAEPDTEENIGSEEPDTGKNTGSEEPGNDAGITDGMPEDTENRLPEAADGSGEEDFSYYRVVTATVIDDPWFTMEVPESLVGEISYGVVLKENEAGEKYLQNLTFFHIDSMEAEAAPENAPQYSWRDVYWLGALCSYDWTGYPELEEDLEEIAYRSGTWDIRGMEFLLARDYDGYAGVSGRLVQANEAGTGAYFYMEPTDVQYDPENPEAYMACAGALAACWDHFAAKSFPYEELEGYSGDASAEMPRWRQDFEEAERIYAWFTPAEQAPVKSARGDGGDYGCFMTPEGLVYSEADVPGVSSMEELRGYLNRYFTPEITEDLLSGRKLSFEKGPAPFLEVDGRLYALEAWVSELGGVPHERQYAACFSELTETGQERPIQIYAENGGRRRVQIYTDCQYNTDDPVPLRAILCYTMEEQEDGSWRIVGDYELATLQMLYTLQE